MEIVALWWSKMTKLSRSHNTYFDKIVHLSHSKIIKIVALLNTKNDKNHNCQTESD